MSSLAEDDSLSAAQSCSTKKRSFNAMSDDSSTINGLLVPAGGDGKDKEKSAPEAAGLAMTSIPHDPAASYTVAASSLHSRYCRIMDTDCICLDANLSDEFKWPSDKMRSKGGLSEWPLWGWLGALQGRTGRVVYTWDRKPKDCKDKAIVIPKKCCKGSRQAGFRLKDAEPDTLDTTMLLLEIDKHYVPILEEVRIRWHHACP